MPEEVFFHFGHRVGFEKAWIILKDSFTIKKNLDDQYVDGTSPELYGFPDSAKGRQDSEGKWSKGEFHEYMDDMIRHGFKERGLDPRHFGEWVNYDENVGSEIEGTRIPGGAGRHEYTDEGWRARLALHDILADLEQQHRAIGPDGDWRKVYPSVAENFPERRGMDPFRMERPDMQAEMEEMATEAGRREGRKEAKGFDEEDADWPYSPGWDLTGRFDEENPHNERLINVTQPQMDERQNLLDEELARRDGD